MKKTLQYAVAALATMALVANAELISLTDASLEGATATGNSSTPGSGWWYFSSNYRGMGVQVDGGFWGPIAGLDGSQGIFLTDNGTATGGGHLYQTVQLDAGRTYTLTVAVAMSTSAAEKSDALYRLMFYNTDRVEQAFSAGTVTTRGSFSDVSVEFTPTTTGNYHIGMRCEGYVPDTGTASATTLFWDNVRLTASTSPVIDTFAADDHYVEPGTLVVLSWLTSNATHIAIDQGVGDVTARTSNGAGSTNLFVNSSTTYTLTVSNLEGNSTAMVQVNVGPPRPNIVLFLVDDMGAQDTSEPFQVDDAGNDIPAALNDIYITPNMEVLADQGMKFTHAYAMPVCTPSRNCIMTGQNSVRHHVTNFTHPYYNTESGYNTTPTHNSPLHWLRTGLDASHPTLPGLLSDAGYLSIHVGKAHFGNAEYSGNPLNIGFDINIGGNVGGRTASYFGTENFRGIPHLSAYHGQDIFLTEALTLEMNQAIEGAVGDGVPFFAYMSHYAVHEPFQSDPRFVTNYPTLSGSTLAFATMVEGMDKSLGDIMDKVNALGVAEDTLVIFMSDNGSDSPAGSSPLRGKKGQRYEGGTRVPLIVGWAKLDGSNAFQRNLDIPADSHESDLVTCFDLFPTILSAAQVSFGHTVDGHDLGAYLRAEPGNHRPQELLVHFPHDHNHDYYTFFREGDYKLIYNYAPNSYELYDLVNDIGESINLADGDPDRVMAMARKMAISLDAHGAQWPTFAASPDYDDPLAMPLLAGVDLDGDGIDDNVEDPNLNGLVDMGETDPDNDNTDATDEK